MYTNFNPMVNSDITWEMDGTKAKGKIHMSRTTPPIFMSIGLRMKIWQHIYKGVTNKALKILGSGQKS